jgi:hypothetical protein
MAKRRLGRNAAPYARLHRIQAAVDLASGSTAVGSSEPGSRRFAYRHGTPIYLIGVLGLLALGLAACSSTPATIQSTTTTTTAPLSGSTTTTVPNAEASAIITAYRAGWAAFEQATKNANPLDPQLQATMVNPLLHQVEGNLVTYNAEGIVGTGSIELHPRLASLTGTKAVVLDCSFSDAFLIYKKTGKQVPPVSKAENVGVKATLVSVGGIWKVKSQNLTEGTCPAGY